MSILSGVVVGFLIWFFVRYGIFGFYTVDQNERAVKTSFGRAQRLADSATLDDPAAAAAGLSEEETRALRLSAGAGDPARAGPTSRWPWERVYKVSIATQTLNMAYDPEDPQANHGGTDARSGHQGPAEHRPDRPDPLPGRRSSNLYAYLFGVKNPIAHVMGYFVSVLRERIANFEAPRAPTAVAPSASRLDADARQRRLDQRPAQEPARPERAHGRECRSLGGALRHHARRLAHHRHRPAGRGRVGAGRDQHRAQPRLLRHQPGAGRRPTRRSCSRGARWRSRP